MKSTCILISYWIRLQHSCCCLSRAAMLLHGSKPYHGWDPGSYAQPTDVNASEQALPQTRTCFIDKNYHSQVYESPTIRQGFFNFCRYHDRPMRTFSKNTTKALPNTNRYDFELRASRKSKSHVVFLQFKKRVNTIRLKLNIVF